jgi:hypothetical protein
MKPFKFFRQIKQPNVPEQYRNDIHKFNAFVEGWEAAMRGEHAMNLRNGQGNPYFVNPLKQIWTLGWRDYMVNETSES